MDFTVEYPVSYYQEGEYRGNSKIKIHRNAQLGLLSNIKTIGRYVIESDVELQSDKGLIYIGQNTVIQSGTKIVPCTYGITENGSIQSRESPYISIGNGVIIKRNCTLQALRIGDNVIIGNNCTLGEGCVIKDNCVLDDNTMVPAFSVIAPFSHCGGMPCRRMEQLPSSFPVMMQIYASTLFDKYLPLS
ncbi:hypothetical protein WA538_000015, partial [Blastocystis sp. DL]